MLRLLMLGATGVFGAGLLVKRWLDEEEKKRILMQQILDELKKKNRRVDNQYLITLQQELTKYTVRELTEKLEQIQFLDNGSIWDFFTEIVPGSADQF
jgi:hypothetical protein